MSNVELITQRHFDSFPSPLSNYRSNFFYSTKKKNKTRSLYTKEGPDIVRVVPFLSITVINEALEY